ncbi:MAG TPA: AsmA family protein, partial [Puia sp.]|nr:AsmA family protein [Puia sp.]
MKKIVRITSLVLLLLIAFAFAAPFVFKGKIISIIKSQVNKNLNASVDFTDADVSLFRHFPKLAVAIDNLKVTGIDEFADDTLISASNIDISLNLMSVFSGDNMKIYAININEPRIHAIVHKNGHANWSITKPDTAQQENTTASAPFKMKLQKYSISNGYVNYKDEASNMSSEIINLNHEGSGDFTADLFTLTTKTNADAVSFNYGGVPYLLRTKTTLDADIQVDNKTNKYSFKTDKIALNDLKLNAEGFFQFAHDGA